MKVGGRQNNTTTTIQDVHILGFTRDITDVIKAKELECEKVTLDYPGSCKFLKVEEGDETEEAGEIQNMKDAIHCCFEDGRRRPWSKECSCPLEPGNSPWLAVKETVQS